MNKTSHDSETPAQGQQVITACAFIHQNIKGLNKVFFPKRANTKKFMPGVYELPGGHIDFGENIIDGLKREIKEELGININVGDAFAAIDYMNEIKGSHSVEIIYFATLIGSPDNITLDPNDHSSYKWLSKDEVDQIIAPLKDKDDPELPIIKKGFSILENGTLNFG